jgi:hypothetical protein
MAVLDKQTSLYKLRMWDWADMSYRGDCFDLVGKYDIGLPIIICSVILDFAAKVFVPKIFLPKDLKETFNREVSELFKTAGFNDVENKKIKMKNALSFFDQLGENFIKILYSKNMLVAYVFAFAIFISLKYVL